MALSPTKSLVSVPTRPLNQGMRLDLPPNGMPTGSFLRLQNYRVPSSGIERRDGFIPYHNNNGPDQYNERLLYAIHFFTKDQEAETLILTDSNLYKRTGSNTTDRKSISYNIVITSNTAATTSGFASFTAELTEDEYAEIKSNDILTVDGGTYKVASKGVYSVDSATFRIIATGVTLDEFVSSTVQTLTLELKAVGDMSPTYAVLPNASTEPDQIVIADQADRGLYQYTVLGGLEKLPIDSSIGGATDENYTNIISGRTITYFQDRLWMANTVEQDGIHNQRIRWSQAIDFDRFYYENYVDLPYSEGSCIALVPLGSLLVAYFEDAIYLGRPSSLYGRPLTFERLETGNVGLINTRAVTSYTDAHFFVGQDDVYTLGGTTALQSMDIPVIEETLNYTKRLNPDFLNYISVVHDQFEDTVVFMFPDYNDTALPLDAHATRLWRYNYKTNAWSYDEVAFSDEAKTVPYYLFTGISPSKTYIYGRSWEEWQDLDDPYVEDDSDNAKWVRGDNTTIPEGDTFDDYNTWYDLKQEVRKAKSLKIQVWDFATSKTLLIEEEENSVADYIGDNTYPIWALFETPDSDINAPDVTKTWTRISLKTFQNRSDRIAGSISPLVFTTYVSSDMGWKWKRPYTMRFPYEVNGVGTIVRAYNEGKIDFRATGSTLRFKCVSAEQVSKWRLSEYVTLLSGRGLQISI